MVSLGQYDEAIQRLTGREFAVWEGGNLNVADNWTDAHILRGRKLLEAKHAQEARAEFEAALEIPRNLPSEGIDVNGREPEADYWIGSAYAASGDAAQAKKYWQKSADVKLGTQRPHRRQRGGFAPSDLQAYYQALSLRKLGQADKATELLQQLVETANQALQAGPAKPDLSAPLDSLKSQRAALGTAHYAAGLGYLGLNEKLKAREELTKALAASPDQAGAKAELAELR
jgi:tetratricopeptide (TPR) repeat protein